MEEQIRIECQKEVNGNGVQGYRITKIQAKRREDLPGKYLDGDRVVVYLGGSLEDPVLYIELEGKAGYINGNWRTVQKTFYSREDMRKINDLCDQAGQHLRDVNLALSEARKGWEGTAVFVDGVDLCWGCNKDIDANTDTNTEANTEAPLSWSEIDQLDQIVRQLHKIIYHL